jgi:hypothetical protein
MLCIRWVGPDLQPTIRRSQCQCLIKEVERSMYVCIAEDAAAAVASETDRMAQAADGRQSPKAVVAVVTEGSAHKHRGNIRSACRREANDDR